MKLISIEIVLKAFEQVISHREDLATNVTLNAATNVADLELDSLDLAEVLILIEQEIGYELDPFSIENILKVNDFTLLKNR